ncbi:hypothetical protein [Sphingobium chlorophenolicum]|nr:hypothetical protein [Sphingobium chlorophenolicum]
MNAPRKDMQLVTLLLHDMQGQAWRLSLSADCLPFIGNYRRVEGFNIDAVVALDGLRKKG